MTRDQIAKTTIDKTISYKQDQVTGDKILDLQTYEISGIIENVKEQLLHTYNLFIKIFENISDQVGNIIDNHVRQPSVKEQREKGRCDQLTSYKNKISKHLITSKKKQKNKKEDSTEQETCDTDSMISHSDTEIDQLDSVVDIIELIIPRQQTITIKTNNFLAFLKETVSQTKKILHTSRECCTGNIKNIANFTRDKIPTKILEMYQDEICNTMAQMSAYNSLNDTTKKLVFLQPFVKLKKSMLSEVNESLIERITHSDIWIEDILQKVFKYLSKEGAEISEIKENQKLFKLAICVLSATHLSMYGVIKQEHIKSQAQDFIKVLEKYKV